MTDVFAEPGEDGGTEQYFQEAGNTPPEPVETPIETPITQEVQDTPKQPEPEAKPEVKEKYVPHEALHEERMLRKETQQELSTVKAQVESLKSLKDELNEFRRAQRSEQEQRELEEDPIAAMLKRQQQMADKFDQMEASQAKASEASEQERTEQAEVATLTNNIVTSVQEFKGRVSDYDQAYTHLRESRAQELQMMGLTSQEVIATLNAEEMNIGKSALERGMNPAEIVYNLAKQRGYTAPNPELDRKIETIEKGVNVSQTLSNSGGTGEKSELSLQSIEQMSDEDFDKLWDEMEGKAIPRH